MDKMTNIRDNYITHRQVENVATKYFMDKSQMWQLYTSQTSGKCGNYIITHRQVATINTSQTSGKCGNYITHTQVENVATI